MSGNPITHAIGENTEVSTSGVGDGGNLEGVIGVREMVKAGVYGLLDSTKKDSQDEDISNTIPPDFDAKVQYYQTNKHAIIEVWMQEMKHFHLGLQSIILAQVGIGNYRVGHHTLPIKSIDDFMQSVYCDIMDFVIEKCRNASEDDEELEDLTRVLFGCAPSFLDHITDERQRFSYILQMLRNNYLVYYASSAMGDWYHGYLWRNPKGAMNLFVRELKIREFKTMSDIQSLILILKNLIDFSAEFYQHDVGASLQKILDLVYQQFGHLAFTHFLKGVNREELGQFYLRNALDLPQELYDCVEQEGSFDLGYNAYTHMFGRVNLRNPIYRISSDRAIQMDINATVPQHLYDIGNEDILLEGESYRNIFSTVDEIFLSRSSAKDEDYTYLIQLLHRPHVMAQIESAIDIKFSDYPFSIQPHFLKFLAYATVDDMARVKIYLAHGKTLEEKFIRLRVFLATSEGRSFGDLILDIDNKLVEKFGEIEGAKTGNDLFMKYADIMKIAEEDAESIKGEYYGTDSNAQFSKQKYIQELLGKANDTLENFFKVLQNENSFEAITGHLTACSAGMIQYGTLFRVTDKNFDNKKPLVDSLKELGIELVEKSGPEMNSNERADMMQLYETNYQSHPKKVEFLANIAQVLESNYQNPQAKFFLLKYRESVLLSVKCVGQEDGSVYFGAFNTALYFQQNQLGVLVLEKLLENYADKIIRGHVIQEEKKLIRYYRQYGFEMEKDENGNVLKPDVVSGIEFCRMIGYPKKTVKGVNNSKKAANF